jgi:hypothetical protein
MQLVLQLQLLSQRPSVNRTNWVFAGVHAVILKKQKHVHLCIACLAASATAASSKHWL